MFSVSMWIIDCYIFISNVVNESDIGVTRNKVVWMSSELYFMDLQEYSVESVTSLILNLFFFFFLAMNLGQRMVLIKT